jgi:hypothetical protein
VALTVFESVVGAEIDEGKGGGGGNQGGSGGGAGEADGGQGQSFKLYQIYTIFERLTIASLSFCFCLCDVQHHKIGHYVFLSLKSVKLLMNAIFLTYTLSLELSLFLELSLM